MCFVGGQLLGDEKELLKWSHHEWDYRDFKPEALYQAIAEDFYTKYLKNSQASSTVLREECKVCKWPERLCDERAHTTRRKESEHSGGSFLVSALRWQGQSWGRRGRREHPLPRTRTAKPPRLLAARKGQTLARMPDVY